MIYFRENNDMIEKYQVDFDEEEIENLKKKIIDNCSFIEHKEYKSDYFPTLTNKIIRNYKSTPTGEKKEYFEETRDIYLFKFDEYHPPYLIELINKLLKHDSKVIEEILVYDITSKSSIDEKINLVNQEFIKIDPENITKRKAKLKELENLLKAKELNKNQQNIDLYYHELIELMKFELVDSLPMSELNRIETFFEIEQTKKIIIHDAKENKRNKIMKKKNE